VVYQQRNAMGLAKERSKEKLKVTIRGVNAALWTKAKIECVESKTLTLGEIVNDGLAKRYGKEKPRKK
jgi:hypothetical protein